MKLFLGVDGGQSRTTALIGDEEGRVLGAGAGGPCNHAGAEEGRQKLARGGGGSVGGGPALAGATAGKPGIVMIAGTGSIAFGRNAGGRTARAGGWGFIFGDEGGAFD